MFLIVVLVIRRDASDRHGSADTDAGLRTDAAALSRDFGGYL